MMTLYTFEDEDGNQFGTFTTLDYREAKRYASEHGLLVVGNEYEWSEAVPLDDYRSIRVPDIDTRG